MWLNQKLTPLKAPSILAQIDGISGVGLQRGGLPLLLHASLVCLANNSGPYYTDFEDPSRTVRRLLRFFIFLK